MAKEKGEKREGEGRREESNEEEKRIISRVKSRERCKLSSADIEVASTIDSKFKRRFKMM